MGRRIQKTSRQINGVGIEQRLTDGFINGTAMAVAHRKDIAQWFRTKNTLDLFCALADDLGVSVNSVDLQNSDISRLSASKYTKLFQVAANNMENQGMHPINAIRLAARQVLPSNHTPKPIDFTERIALVRLRIEQARQKGMLPNE